MIYIVKNKLRKMSHQSKFAKRIYLFANKFKLFLLKHVSDESFAKMKYKENTGGKLNLKNPITYNEKLWWLKLNNRDPLLTICSDKFKVREYVKKCGYDHILIKEHGIYKSPDDIPFSKLPEKVFIKCTHGSGTNIIYDQNASFDIRSFKKKFTSALQENYYWQSREWNYKNIEPHLIVEEYLDVEKENMLVDYRFMCFEGEIKIIFADIGTSAPDGSHAPEASRNVYDVDFNILDVTVGRKNFPKELLTKPQNFEEMKKIAEVLSRPFPHCRVDLYNINGEIYFGEITFYPGGATQKISPKEWDVRLGSWINLKSDKIKKK